MVEPDGTVLILKLSHKTVNWFVTDHVNKLNIRKEIADPMKIEIEKVVENRMTAMKGIAEAKGESVIVTLTEADTDTVRIRHLHHRQAIEANAETTDQEASADDNVHHTLSIHPVVMWR